MEGYLLVASAAARYFEMAANAARSIRFFDPDRPICLACDDPASIAEDDRALFDHVVALENPETRRGTEHHLYLNRITPFERTLYVDADCLVSSARIHDIWRLTADRPIAFPGRRKTEGFWRLDIEVLRQQLGIDYVVQLNGGVFFFDQSEAANRFFATAQDLLETRGREVSVRHGKGRGLANEPIWGATHALTNTPEFPLGEQLNVSTLRTERWEITTAPSIRLHKDGRTFDPVITHFLGLDGPKCPNDLYQAFSRVVREGPPAELITGSGPETTSPPAAAAPEPQAPAIGARARRIVGVMLVKNEDIFVTAALRNALGICDEMILLDNFSTDGTWSALEQIADEQRKKVMLLRIRNAKQSHRLLQDYAGKPVFVFGVDGDEIYDPAGLSGLRRRIMGGMYDDAWCLYGHALHCTHLDIAAGTATGFQTPQARSMTKLYNFGIIDAWEEPHQQRLHGVNIQFKPGYSTKSSDRSFQQKAWDRSVFRCLHMCFLPRSTMQPGDLGNNARRNISELHTKRDLGDGWKATHYAVGATITREIAPFFDRQPDELERIAARLDGLRQRATYD